jgi:[acyl-carrier-protein] S-malonyltransferase
VKRVSELAWVFPGQGSQYVGMGKDLAEAYTAARETFLAADSVLGFSLASICFTGPEDRLKETRYTQLAVLAHDVAVSRVLGERGQLPAFVAGHSVGEYAALVAAGAIGFEDALRLVRTRAEAMYVSGLESPGGMAALIGMPEAALGALLEEAGKSGIIEAANYNSPLQVVVSGEAGAIARAMEVAPSMGAKRAIRLKVSGAFHSPLMEDARQVLSAAIARVTFFPPRVPVVSNVTGHSVTEPAEIAHLLELQLVSPVKWQQSVEFMAGEGVQGAVECGPGEVLCGLGRRISPGLKWVPCSDPKTIEAFLSEVEP